MSTYSLDSLDRELNVCGKSTTTKPEVDCISQLAHNNSGDWEDKNEKLTDNADKDNEFNESSFVTITTIRKRKPVKFGGNSIIATEEFRSRVEKLPGILSTKSHFRTGRTVEKKFNVPKLSSSSFSPSSSLSSSTSSTSSTEFRHGTASLLLTKKRPDDVTEFMKADKKPGNVQPDILLDKRKKPVSYMQLYRKRFGVDRRQLIDIPVSLPLSRCDNKSEERTAQEIDNSADLHAVSTDENSNVGSHCRELQLDSFVENEVEDNAGTRVDYSVGYFQVDEQPKNRTKRVFYEPYSIEDYKSFSVPRADRSLGPDRNEMESKGEWLMRRRTYGDSVSAFNRQRILRRAEKLKRSRRVDSQKLPLHPTSTDLKYPGPASKVEGMLGPNEGNIISAGNSSRLKERTDIKQGESATRIREKSSNASKKDPASLVSKRKSKVVNLTRVDSNFYETSSDTFDDDSIHLKKLRNRHLEEKKTIDHLFKRGLSA